MATGPISASTLVSLSGIVLAKCYNYGCAVADAPAEVKRLLGEVTSLSGLLVTMQACEGVEDNALPGCDLGKKPSEKWMEAMGAPLEQCQQTLQEIRDTLDKAKMDADRRSGRTLKRLTWPLKQKDTMTLVERLERHKATFTIALTKNAVSITKATQEDVHDIRVELDNSRMERQAEETVRQQQRIYRWLTSVEFETTHTTASALHYPGTGEWFLESKEMRLWVEACNAFLWVHGIPGSGKTVLTSTILNRIVLPLRAPKNAVAYFYCDFREKDSQRPEAVIGSIICQLCKQFDRFPSIIENSFKSHTSDDGRTTSPSYKELERIFLAVLSLCRQATIVIDALDECQQRSNLLQLLSECGQRSARVLVTSRREMDIVKAFGALPQISLMSEEVDGDIQRYIANLMDTNSVFATMKASLKASIVSSLTEGATGMFRWAQCQIDDISRLRTDKAIRLALKSLPRDLDETYERILNRISGYDHTFAKRALMWLAFSFRPLKLSELAEAVIIEVGNFDLDPEERLRDRKDILTVCGSLVTYAENTEEVVLAHHSVQEFLLSQRAQLSHPIYYLPYDQSDAQVAKSCLTYVLQSSFSNGPCTSGPDMEARLNGYPLLNYAAKFWAIHAANSYTNDQELTNLVMFLMSSPRTPGFMAWVQVICLASEPHLWFLYPGHATPLYYASSYGLLGIVESLLAGGEDINGTGGMYGGTALHAAVWREHSKIVATLLQKGADTRIEDFNGHTPVDLARGTGNQKILELMGEQM